MNTNTPIEVNRDETPSPTIERFHKVYYGVYASEGFGEDGPIAMFRVKLMADRFVSEMACDCIVLETKVNGSFDNAS